MLQNRRIVLGVTGGIAAYKAAALTSLLVKNHAEVEVLMTAAATRLVTPLTFATLSRREVHQDLFAPYSCSPQHIALAACDLFVVAPLTANTLAKIACGLADNLLTSTLLATSAPLLLAPAMNNQMWEHPATQENLAIVRRRGAEIVMPENGCLACGTTAVGRLAEPETILAHLISRLAPQTV
jgi:phosphopantothenoylcysteine decarboxylase/phosphopantothenate--cysteine ligase